MKKITILLSLLLFCGITAFAADYGAINVDPSVNKLKSKTAGNTFGTNFDACFFIPIETDGVVYFYYIKEGTDKYLTSLLLMKYAMKENFNLHWSGSTETFNGKVFRRIVMIQ